MATCGENIAPREHSAPSKLGAGRYQAKIYKHDELSGRLTSSPGPESALLDTQLQACSELAPKDDDRACIRTRRAIVPEPIFWPQPVTGLCTNECVES